MGTIDRDHCDSSTSRRWLMLFLATLALPIITVCAVEWMMGEAAGASGAQAADAQAAKSKDVLNGPAPELVGIKGWANSNGTTLADLRGQVVVLHFWTSGCINCVHNLPVYNAWARDFSRKGVRIIGVHTPETDDEAKPDGIAEQVKRRGIEYPVAFDRDGQTWKAFGNHYWPAVYLIDRKGRVRDRWEGELESNNRHGDSLLRGKIEALLAETR